MICIKLKYFTPLAHILLVWRKINTSSLYLEDWYYCSSSAEQPSRWGSSSGESEVRLPGFYAGKCRNEWWKSAWSSCEWRAWLPMSASLSGTLSSGNMDLFVRLGMLAENQKEITLHGCDIHISWVWRCRIDWFTTNSHCNLSSFLTSDIIVQSHFRYSKTLCSLSLTEKMTNHWNWYQWKWAIMCMYIYCCYFNQTSKWLLFTIIDLLL